MRNLEQLIGEIVVESRAMRGDEAVVRANFLGARRRAIAWRHRVLQGEDLPPPRPLKHRESSKPEEAARG